MPRPTLRAPVLALALALDPDRQGECWPDPIAWDGRPLAQQARDLLVLARDHESPAVREAADALRSALDSWRPSERPSRDAYLRVRVTADALADLERIAAEDGATVSEVARRLIAAEIRRRA